MEKAIEAVAVSTVTTTEEHTRSAVDGLRIKIQAQLTQNRANFEQRQENTVQSIPKVSAGLELLTKQLNQLKPASEESVGALQSKVTEEFQQRLVTQAERIDKLSESVMESQKSVKDTAETMHPILVGMETWVKISSSYRKVWITCKPQEIQKPT